MFFLLAFQSGLTNETERENARERGRAQGRRVARMRKAKREQAIEREKRKKRKELENKEACGMLYLQSAIPREQTKRKTKNKTMKTKLNQYRKEESATTFVGFQFTNDLNEKGELLLDAQETQALIERLESYHAPRSVRLGETVIRTLPDMWLGSEAKDGWQKATPNAAMKTLGAALKAKCKAKLNAPDNERTFGAITVALIEAIAAGKLDNPQWPSAHSARLKSWVHSDEPLSDDQWARIGCYLLWTPPVKKEKVAVELPVIDF